MPTYCRMSLDIPLTGSSSIMAYVQVFDLDPRPASNMLSDDEKAAVESALRFASPGCWVS
jgi:hypothetical protein